MEDINTRNPCEAPFGNAPAQGRLRTTPATGAGLPQKRPAGNGATLVYIEADRANALLMQWLLESRTTFTLHHAVDGHSGLELCRRFNPDLVITEKHLPDMTGHEVLRGLRAAAGKGGPPCIALSGDAWPDNIRRALHHGFDDYWTKPIDIWQLLQQLEQALTNAN